MKNVVLYYHRVRNKQLRLIIREVDDKARAKNVCAFISAFRYELEEKEISKSSFMEL